MGRRSNPSSATIYLLAGLGTYLFCSLAFGSTARRTPLDYPNERVLLIGDSLATQPGIGSRLSSGLQSRGVGAFQNISVGGTNILQWSDNRYAEGQAMERALADFRPTLVLISLGTNDEASRGYKNWRGRDWDADDLAANRVGPNADIAAQRRSAIERLARKLSGVKSVWLGPPASDPSLWPMDRKFRSLLADTWGQRYFNTEAVAPAKGSDGIHLSGSGYQTWANAILAFLDAGI